MKTCAMCGKGMLMPVDDIVSQLEGYFIVVRGRRCTACGEEYIDEPEGQRMIQIAKRFGIWGTALKLHRKLSKSGRGTVLRIPTDIEQNLHLKGNESVAISKFGKNKILVEIE